MAISIQQTAGNILQEQSSRGTEVASCAFLSCVLPAMTCNLDLEALLSSSCQLRAGMNSIL